MDIKKINVTISEQSHSRLKEYQKKKKHKTIDSALDEILKKYGFRTKKEESD